MLKNLFSEGVEGNPDVLCVPVSIVKIHLAGPVLSHVTEHGAGHSSAPSYGVAAEYVQHHTSEHSKAKYERDELQVLLTLAFNIIY